METLELSRAELWFCAPDVPAVGEAVPFHLAMAQGERHLWVRVVPSVLKSVHENTPAWQLFWQEEDARGKSAVLSDGTFYNSQELHPDNENWRRRLGRMIADRTCRVWRPEEDERFAVTFYNYGEAGIQSLPSTGNRFVTTGFIWQEEANADFAWWPQAEFDGYFARQFADPNSSLRCAYEWNVSSDDERTARVMRCEGGSWQEMKSLAECVLTLTPAPEDEDDPFSGFAVWDMLDEDGDPFYSGSHQLTQWSKLFQRVFRPLILRADVTAYEHDHASGLYHELHPLFPHSEPSAHEKLEAHLRLREWVMEHVPDEAERLLDFSRSS